MAASGQDNSGTLVCVTGSNGFIGAHVVNQLLRQGYRVRGTVRDPSDEAKTSYLTALPGASERLEIVKGTFEKDGFKEAIAGCNFVIHTASPFVMDAKNWQRDVVEPAVAGTVEVLLACEAAASVQRLVLTSSMAAVMDEPVTGYTFSEKDWNEKSTLSRNPYYLSKARAEAEAWAFMKAEERHFTLSVINPLLTIGPRIGGRTNTSVAGIIRDSLNGNLPAALALTWGVVDVRDVARGHIEAMKRGDVEGRNILIGHQLPMDEALEVMRGLGAKGKKVKVPTMKWNGSVGSFMIRNVLAWTMPAAVRSYMRTHVGKVLTVDTSKAEKDLGMEWTPLATTFRDCIQDLHNFGDIKLDADLEGAQGATVIPWNTPEAPAPAAAEGKDEEEEEKEDGDEEK